MAISAVSSINASLSPASQQIGTGLQATAVRASGSSDEVAQATAEAELAQVMAVAKTKMASPPETTLPAKDDELRRRVAYINRRRRRSKPSSKTPEEKQLPTEGQHLDVRV